MLDFDYIHGEMYKWLHYDSRRSVATSFYYVAEVVHTLEGKVAALENAAAQQAQPAQWPAPDCSEPVDDAELPPITCSYGGPHINRNASALELLENGSILFLCSECEAGYERHTDTIFITGPVAAALILQIRRAARDARKAAANE